MGAYYRATVDGVLLEYVDETGFAAYKMGEHAYVLNDYVFAVMRYIKRKKPERVVWLCDYHEPCDAVPETWGTVKRVKLKTIRMDDEEYFAALKRFVEKQPFMVCPQRKEYVNLLIILEKAMQAIKSGVYFYHPLPLLTASDENAMGGGDVSAEEFPLRARWRGCSVEFSRNTPSGGFINITISTIKKEEV